MRYTASEARRILLGRERPWDAVEGKITAALQNPSTASATTVQLSPPDLEALRLALNTLNQWDLYLPELVALRKRIAAAELEARGKKRRAWDDAFLQTLGYTQRGGKPSKRLSRFEESELVRKYKELQ